MNHTSPLFHSFFMATHHMALGPHAADSDSSPFTAHDLATTTTTTITNHLPTLRLAMFDINDINYLSLEHLE